MSGDTDDVDAEDAATDEGDGADRIPAITVPRGRSHYLGDGDADRVRIQVDGGPTSATVPTATAVHLEVTADDLYIATTLTPDEALTLAGAIEDYAEWAREFNTHGDTGIDLGGDEA